MGEEMKEELSQKVVKVKEVLENIKLIDINLIDLKKKSPFFDYFVIATCNSRQASAVISELKKEFREDIKNISESDVWSLVDLGSIIVHLFNEETRKTYNLDSLGSK
jgi:ribosome-associated protein